MGADAEIEEDAVRAGHAEGREQPLHFKKITVDRCESGIGGEPASGFGDRIAVAVDAEELSAFAEALQNAFTVTAAAESAVNKDAAALRPEKVEHFIEHDRHMIAAFHWDHLAAGASLLLSARDCMSSANCPKSYSERIFS